MSVLHSTVRVAGADVTVNSTPGAPVLLPTHWYSAASSSVRLVSVMMLVTCPVVSVELAILEIVTSEDSDISTPSFSQIMDTTGRPPTTQERLAIPAV